MTPFSKLTGRARLVEVLRWLCVLPGASLVDFVVEFVVGTMVQIAGYGGWGTLGESNIANALRIFLYYVPQKSAFVVAGAKIAPRHQVATAIVLTVLGLFLSVLTHVVVQQLDGKPVVTTNYMHAFAESAGVLGGAAYIAFQARKNRRERSATP